MSWAKQLTFAGVLVAGAASALVFLGRPSADGPSEQTVEGKTALDPASSKKSDKKADASSSDTKRPASASGPAIAHSARALLPQEAWLVADFRGDLTGTRPFEDQEGLCQKVSAPPRVALGVLPPLEASSEGGPELMLAAPNVEDTFWGCARDRIVRAGGTVLAQNDRFEVLKSPSGVVALGPGRAMIFLSNEKYLERGLSVMSDLENSAASTGVHAGLFRKMHPTGDQEKSSALDLTLYVPDDWLSSVGQEAELSPLRHLKAGFLSVKEDGSAQGGVDCAEPGCKDMFSFLQGAKKDLSQSLPASKRTLIDAALKVDYVENSGRVIINWSPKDIRIQDLLAGFLGGPGLFRP